MKAHANSPERLQRISTEPAACRGTLGTSQQRLMLIGPEEMLEACDILGPGIWGRVHRRRSAGRKMDQAKEQDRNGE